MRLALSVGPLIAVFERFTSEVTIRSGQLVHRVQQVEHLSDAVRTQVEVLTYQLDDTAVADAARAEGVDGDGRRFRHTDGVGDLDFAFIRQTRCHDVLRDIAASVSSAAVNLRRILTGERTATVTRHATVSINDDLAASQTTVAHRATNDEVAGRVDVEAGVFGDPFCRQYIADNQLFHGLTQFFLRHVFIMLSGQHDRFDRFRLAFGVVAEGQLAFRVRTQPWQRAILAQLGLTFDQSVCVMDRRRHQRRGFVGGIAEHQPLITGTLIFGAATIDALSDIDALLADQVDDTARCAVETDLRRGITDIENHVTNQVFQVNPCACGDLACHYRHASLDQRFTRNTCLLVTCNQGVQYRVRNLIRDLVGMPFGYRFRSKEVGVAHYVSTLIVVGS
ncbi:glutamyl-tRNA reductase [Zymobacter palmae]|uniref:Glutamyl-tRNA reductase n=1 Tax=Zymobacter palmae TaxID=33074 RepID=A0A348HID3_9GAMM|nr:glutamyl-tRNA reductase [Zymobacter palmae]